MGATIRAARCAKRMTQTQLGHACGYSASAISRIESGALRPGGETHPVVAPPPVHPRVGGGTPRPPNAARPPP
ncbi:helix-turn-helix domain-containing protein, partial [Kitasatospora purpeofusca]|uniref:helix-turn-helix domain-containing protein n=1 Tax=Kitasatospora purpeofusca TaxID=67352 RepID=UPI0036567C7D